MPQRVGTVLHDERIAAGYEKALTSYAVDELMTHVSAHDDADGRTAQERLVGQAVSVHAHEGFLRWDRYCSHCDAARITSSRTRCRS